MTVRTGPQPPIGGGMPGMPPNPYAPVPQMPAPMPAPMSGGMPLAGGPPPGVNPNMGGNASPRPDLAQMGSNAPRRRMFGDYLEGTLSRNMPSSMPANATSMGQMNVFTGQQMAPQMAPQQRRPMPMPQQRRPMMANRGGIAGYHEGGGVTHDHSNFSDALEAEVSSLGDNFSGYDPSVGHMFKGVPMSSADYSDAVQEFRAANSDIAASADASNFFDTETNTHNIRNNSTGEIGSYVQGTTYDDPTTEDVVEELPSDVAYSRQVQENRAAVGLPANTTSAWELWKNGEHYSQKFKKKKIEEEVILPVIEEPVIEEEVIEEEVIPPVIYTGPTTTYQNNDTGGTYTADAVDDRFNIPIDYDKFVGETVASIGNYEPAALFGPNPTAPATVSQVVSDGAGGLTYTNGPYMSVMSGIGGINLPARPVTLDIFDFLSTPAYGTFGVNNGAPLYNTYPSNNLSFSGKNAMGFNDGGPVQHFDLGGHAHPHGGGNPYAAFAASMEEAGIGGLSGKPVTSEAKTVQQKAMDMVKSMNQRDNNKGDNKGDDDAIIETYTDTSDMNALDQIAASNFIKDPNIIDNILAGADAGTTSTDGLLNSDIFAASLPSGTDVSGLAVPLDAVVNYANTANDPVAVDYSNILGDGLDDGLSVDMTGIVGRGDTNPVSLEVYTGDNQSANTLPVGGPGTFSQGALPAATGGNQSATNVPAFTYTSAIDRGLGGADTDPNNNMGSTDEGKLKLALLNALKKRISVVEGTDDKGAYDRLLGYSEGKFGIKPSEMTVQQILDFQKQRGPGSYANYAIDAVGRISTPVGKYQVVGKTLQDLVDRGLVDPNAMFDADTQEAIGTLLIENRGLFDESMTREDFEAALGKEFEGIKRFGYDTGLSGSSQQRAIQNLSSNVSSSDMSKIDTQLQDSVPVQGLAKFLSNVGGAMFFGLGKGLVDDLVGKTEAQRANVVKMHTDALGNGATPQYDDEGKYIGYDKSTMGTFADKVLAADDIDIFLPPSSSNPAAKANASGLTDADGNVINDITRFQQVFDAQSKAAEADPYGASTENGFITSDGREFVVTLDGKLLEVENSGDPFFNDGTSVVGTGESFLNSGVGTGTDVDTIINTIVGGGDDDGDDDDVKDYNIIDGEYVCKKEGYVYNSDTDSCAPKEESKVEIVSRGLNRPSAASRFNENYGTQTGRVNIAPLNQGGMVNTNRMVDEFLVALGA